VTTPEIASELDRFFRQIASAAAERNPDRLMQVLEAQKQFITAHVGVLDEASRMKVRAVIEQALLAAKASRAHCVDAIQMNQRKLSVLTAYQAG
jgi:hypothetical protein